MGEPIGRLDVNFRKVGAEGPVVVFLAGAGAHGSPWAEYESACAASGLRTASVRCSPEVGETVPSIADLSDELARTVRDESTGPVRLAGFSFGAFVAQQLAADHPGLVTDLLLVATRARVGFFHAELARTRAGYGPRPAQTRAVETALTMLSSATLDDDDTAADWLDLLAMGGEEEDPALLATQNAMTAELSQLDLLPQITARTTVVAFSDDIVTPAAAGREVARTIPGSRFEEVAAAGHLGLVEARRQMLPIVIEAVGR